MRVTVGMALPLSLPVPVQLRLAPFLEALGFDNLWFPDHLLFPELSPAPDCWTLMAAVARRTRRIRLGPAVTDPHRLHPAVFAQRLATLDQLSRGRVILGLGSGEAMNLEPFGIPWDRRVGRTREFLQVVRGLLESPEPFTFEGEFFRLRRARLSIRPYRGRRIPVYLAALGPKMQRLAGRYADGWFPVVVPPRFYADYFRPIAEAARKAGRDPQAMERVASVALALDTRGTLRREKVLQRARSHALSLVWPPVLEQLGVEFDPPEPLRGVDYVSVNPCDPESRRKFTELQEWIPDEVLEPFLCYGHLERIQQVLRAYVEAGATHLNLFNASPEPLASTLVLAARVLPRFTGRPPTLAARLGAALLPLMRRLGLEGQSGPFTAAPAAPPQHRLR